jgi:hypothetical protein
MKMSFNVLITLLLGMMMLIQSVESNSSDEHDSHSHSHSHSRRPIDPDIFHYQPNQDPKHAPHGWKG